MRAFLLYIVILAVATVSCRREEDRATPRPRAYPRIEVPQADYTVAEGVPVHMEVNSHAEYSLHGGETPGWIWIDVRYPTLGATLSMTVTPELDAAALEQALDNRLERIGLNNGGRSGESRTIRSPGGFMSRMVTLGAGTVTPLQFVSVSNRRLVSGALVLDRAAASADSLRPVVECAGRDIVHLLNNLH